MLPAPLTSAARRVRLAVLRRRRLLAAMLTAVAVASGLHAVAAPAPATISVPVAARDLPAGVVLSAADVRTASFAPGSAPDGVAPDAVGRTLAAPLRRGEPLTDVRLVGASLTEGLPGLVAVPVRLPDAGMAGLLEVGDVIDLMAADPQGSEPFVVAASVPVLALPRTVEETAAAALPGRLVVIGARPSDVPELADAALRFFLTYAYSPSGPAR